MTDDLSQLITQMQQPFLYSDAVGEEIELIQTHASYVFLTGDYAYKVKKKVNYGFLDYLTLVKRKYFLDTELRLNRKIAPELYLEVLPISVEYALKMRQFPQENLFSNLVEAGVTSDLFIELGKVVAGVP